jgi:hypothetical protein
MKGMKTFLQHFPHFSSHKVGYGIVITSLLTLIAFIFGILQPWNSSSRRERRASRRLLNGDRRMESRKGKSPERVFSERFEVCNSSVQENPLPSDPDSSLSRHEILSLAFTVISELPKNIANAKENPSDQQKTLLAISAWLEAEGAALWPCVDWSESAAQGVAARSILRGRTRTVILGPFMAVNRAVAEIHPHLRELISSAQSRGNALYILAVDGVAYAVIEARHWLEEIKD